MGGEPVTARLTDIGYVPQDEIAREPHRRRGPPLCGARLRLHRTRATKRSKARCSVFSVSSRWRSTPTPVSSLSRRAAQRAGVGAELLSRPSLLFLDEPTTGLDPGLESRMMELLRALADNSRAVGVVTHATKNLDLCDKLVVMGRGGELSFFGRPEDAIEFFGVKGYDDIHRPRRAARAGMAPPIRGAQQGGSGRGGSRSEANGGGHQGALARSWSPRPPAATPQRPDARVLARRYLKLFVPRQAQPGDPARRKPPLALAIVGLFKADVFVRGVGEPNEAAQVLFVLVITTIWLGSISASREIIKERSVLEREAAVGVRLSAYLLSKVVVLFGLAIVQTVLLGGHLLRVPASPRASRRLRRDSHPGADELRGRCDGLARRGREE